MPWSRPAPEVIDWLNDYFDIVVPAIQSHGGEVLKLLGDGVLAIHRCSSEAASIASACAAAISAAQHANTEMESHNRAGNASGHPVAGLRLRHSVGLHLGEVFYGNVGSNQRMDFTVIGRSVNITARLQALASRLDRDLLISRELASHLDQSVECIGEFELKGIDGTRPVYALAEHTGHPLV